MGTTRTRWCVQGFVRNLSSRLHFTPCQPDPCTEFAIARTDRPHTGSKLGVVVYVCFYNTARGELRGGGGGHVGIRP
ncbi:Hypothetical predicted protein [Marmota monax]|uniref:Uncharacterized protein n=1 Tax=Marmota monax TaxID=9995 RepID=A0A5E4BIT3_MARMO|nr:Hypothetical predicted protein [Marmota monax]